MFKFKIGDQVIIRTTSASSYFLNGHLGTIIGFEPGRPSCANVRIDDQKDPSRWGMVYIVALRDLCHAEVLELEYLIRDYTPIEKACQEINRDAITGVKFSPPATIVFWGDGTKTVVKCQGGDEFDPEKGLAMAIAKRHLGNDGKYYDTFKKFIPTDSKS